MRGKKWNASLIPGEAAQTSTLQPSCWSPPAGRVPAPSCGRPVVSPHPATAELRYPRSLRAAQSGATFFCLSIELAGKRSVSSNELLIDSEDWSVLTCTVSVGWPTTLRGGVLIGFLPHGHQRLRSSHLWEGFRALLKDTSAGRMLVSSAAAGQAFSSSVAQVQTGALTFWLLWTFFFELIPLAVSARTLNSC